MRLIKSFKKGCKKCIYLYKYYIQKDTFTREKARWDKDTRTNIEGGEHLRYNYHTLNENSIVFDLGGYKGDFASGIYDKYKCTVYVFEPHPTFYQHCVERFKDNPKIIPINFGISDTTEVLDISDNLDASSFIQTHTNRMQTITCHLREFSTVLQDLNISSIDLMKINIEGGEYPLMTYLIENNIINVINEYQIQFHNFIEDAESKYDFIIQELSKTHTKTWGYTFVWENWQINT